MKKIELKLFVDGNLIETISVDKYHFIKGIQTREDLLAAMLRRLNDYLGMESFNPNI
jgi:hypothetical protein